MRELAYTHVGYSRLTKHKYIDMPEFPFSSPRPPSLLIKLAFHRNSILNVNTCACDTQHKHVHRGILSFPLSPPTGTRPLYFYEIQRQVAFLSRDGAAEKTESISTGAGALESHHAIEFPRDDLALLGRHALLALLHVGLRGGAHQEAIPFSGAVFTFAATQ